MIRLGAKPHDLIAVYAMMLMILRMTSGAIGLAIIAGTIVLAGKLVAIGHDPRVYLAAYMGIGGILVGGYLLFFAITGRCLPERPNGETR